MHSWSQRRFPSDARRCATPCAACSRYGILRRAAWTRRSAPKLWPRRCSISWRCASGPDRLPFALRGAAMSIYSKILLAVDLNADSIAVGRRARDLAARMGAELTVLHVVEYVPVEPVGENMIPPVPLLDELAASARQRLVTLCADIGVDADHQRVEVGSVKGEVVRVAR